MSTTSYPKAFLSYLFSRSPAFPVLSPQVRHIFKSIPEYQILNWAKKFAPLLAKGPENRKICLYVHIPFCEKLCTFCHCNKQIFRSEVQTWEYLIKLEKQMSTFSPIFKTTLFQSLSVGGGTPSILSTKQIQHLFSVIHRNYSFTTRAQINFEATPNTLTPEKIRILKDSGVTRITLGVQTMDPDVLERVERKQTKELIVDRIRSIKQAFFPILNIDLIAGLPGQTTTSFMNDLNAVIAWNPEIIHVYAFVKDIPEIFSETKAHYFTAKDILLRKNMLVKARKSLLNAGYVTENGNSYFKKISSEITEELLLKKTPGSLLGLGSGAMSRLWGMAVWKTIFQDRIASPIHYRGVPVNPRYHLAEHLIYNLADGLDLKKIAKSFNHSVEEMFQAEIQLLKDLKVIGQKKNFLYCCGKKNQQGLFKYFSYAQLFYGHIWLDRLRQALRLKHGVQKKFPPSIKETFKDVCMNSDKFILLTHKYL